MRYIERIKWMLDNGYNQKATSMIVSATVVPLVAIFIIYYIIASTS